MDTIEKITEPVCYIEARSPEDRAFDSQVFVEPIPTYHRPSPKIGRNEPCGCGSGKKFKKCCLGKPAEKLENNEYVDFTASKPFEEETKE